MTHARKDPPATDHFEVKDIPGGNFPKVKGLKTLLRSEKIARELTGLSEAQHAQRQKSQGAVISV